MSSFTSPAILEVLDNYCFRVVDPFQFYRGEAVKPESTYTVPAGFVTDLASVPRILWTLLPPHGRYAKAAILHDYLLTLSRKRQLSRYEADIIFYEAMRVLNVPMWQAWLMYKAVSLYTAVGGNHVQL